MSGDDHDHDHNAPESGPALRVKALESLLVEKGLVQPTTLDALVDTYETKVGPRNGARVVARAWSDPAYKGRLLDNATAAIEELGFPPGPQGEYMMVLENTPRVHNMVVCTLCSCYRAVSEPRGVLKEFGLDLSSEVEIRVWDSSAEMRYMVLPMRPTGTENLNEQELAAIVTRDAMIGTAVVKYPPEKTAAGPAQNP
jgi:nitrile hydratase